MVCKHCGHGVRALKDGEMPLELFKRWIHLPDAAGDEWYWCDSLADTNPSEVAEPSLNDQLKASLEGAKDA